MCNYVVYATIYVAIIINQLLQYKIFMYSTNLRENITIGKSSMENMFNDVIFDYYPA